MGDRLGGVGRLLALALALALANARVGAVGRLGPHLVTRIIADKGTLTTNKLHSNMLPFNTYWTIKLHDVQETQIKQSPARRGSIQ